MDDPLEIRDEGFYWVVLGQNPPEVAYWERGEWWLAGDAKPWQPEAVAVVGDRLVFRPRLSPAAGRAVRVAGVSLIAKIGGGLGHRDPWGSAQPAEDHGASGAPQLARRQG